MAILGSTLRFLGLAASVAMALAACSGTVTNTAQVFVPVSGVIQMDIKVPTGETVSSVRFLVDDKLVQEDTDASDGFSAELDTSDFDPDSLVKITALGVHPDKTTVTLRENLILVGKQGDEEAAASPSPSPSASAAPTPQPDATGTK
jgi:hypothetical protein